MRAVAKTAVLTVSASTPVMCARFQFANIRVISGNVGFVHRFILSTAVYYKTAQLLISGQDKACMAASLDNGSLIKPIYCLTDW